MLLLKQSTASQEVLLGPFLDDTDGKTAETGLTIANTDIKVWKNGATTLASKNSGGATHISNGNYYAVLDATDTDTLGSLELVVQVSGALPVRRPALVVTSAAYDVMTAVTGDAYARLGAPAGASVSVDVAAVKTQTAAIETDTQDIQARIPAALVSGRIDASVGAMAANVMTAAAAASDLTTELQSGLATAAGLTTVAGYIDTEVAAIKAKTDNLPTDPADASDIAASFSTVNTKLDTIDDFLDTEVAAIKAKTDNLPADPADASDVAGAFTTVNGSLTTIAGYLDTEVAAIKAKTDNLPSDPADASDVSAALTTITGYIDTEVAAIKAKTDLIPASPATEAQVAALLTTQMTESYAADGAAPTLAQALFLIQQMLGEFSISGTTLTVKKLDGSTTGATFTLNDGTSPTAVTRSG